MTKNNQSIDRLDDTNELSSEVRGGLQRMCPVDAPPNRTAMLSSVYQAVDAEEHKMNPLKRLFTGQRWYLKTALAVFALAAITALAFIVPSLDNLKEGPGNQSAWAAANGYQLVYELAAVPCATLNLDEGGTLDIPHMDELQLKLGEWAEARRAVNPEEYADKKLVAMQVKASPEGVQVAVGLPGADIELAEELRTALAEIAGLPEPQLSEMTWFYDATEGINDGGLTISINDHQFTFPAGVSPEEMENEIKAWFIAQGVETEVDISISTSMTGDREEKRIEIRIESDGEGCE